LSSLDRHFWEIREDRLSSAGPGAKVNADWQL
jgi:hypothetical protein